MILEPMRCSFVCHGDPQCCHRATSLDGERPYLVHGAAYCRYCIEGKGPEKVCGYDLLTGIHVECRTQELVAKDPSLSFITEAESTMASACNDSMEVKGNESASGYRATYNKDVV